MRTPQLLAVIALCFGLVSAIPLPTAQADDNPRSAASQRLEQGLQRYEAGQLERAHEILRAIDYTHLPLEQRIVLFETIEDLEQRINGVSAEVEQPADASPADLLRRADALASERPAEAAGLYRQVLGDTDADDQTRAQAGARLAQLRRDSQSDLTRLRRQIDEATAAVRAGDYRGAITRLEAVEASGVNLGWFDQQRVEQTLALARERVAAAEPADDAVASAEEPDVVEAMPAPAEPAAAPTPAPVMDDSDLMQRTRRLRAQDRLAQGRQAEAEGQIELAIRHYEQATSFDPDLTEAANRLAAARGRRDQRVADAGLLDDHIGREQLREQDALARFDREIARARQQLAAGNFAQAQDAADEARRTLDLHRRVLRPEQYRTLRHEAEDLAVAIDERRHRSQAVAQRRRELSRAEEQHIARIRSDREQHQQIHELLTRALAMRNEMRYEEALALVDRALAIDPGNISAQAMQTGIRDSWQLVRHRDLQRDRGREIGEQTVDAMEATIPYSDLITYPPDWPELSIRRWRGLAEEGGADIRARRALSQAIPVDFRNAEFADTLDHLREATDLDFVVNWAALQQEGIDRHARVDLRVRELRAERALEMVLDQASGNRPIDSAAAATYTIMDGIVAISTERDLQRSTDTRVYDIRDLLVDIPNFDDAPSFDLQQVLGRRSSDTASSSWGTGGGGGGSSSSGGLFRNAEPGQSDDASRGEFVEEITDLIRDTVGTQDEWMTYGGQVSSLRELNGNLIVRTTPGNHSSIGSLLDQLRETKAIQISVEARFLLVDQHFLENIGVDLDFQITNLGGNFGPLSVAQDSVSLADASNGTSIITPDHFTAQPAGIDAGPGDFVPGEGFTPRTGRAIDIGASFLDDLQVNLLVRATQASQRSISLTAPRVTFMDGQRAHVVVARQVAFISDLEAVPDAIGFTPTLGVINSGVILDVEGTVSADRRYVTMTLRPSLATIIEPIRAIAFTGSFIPDDDDDDISAPQTFRGVIEAPELELTQVRSTVHVPDKGTLLIGGQRLVAETEIEAGVPVLSRIPVINRLFTNQSIIQDKRTLLILVKPSIIIPQEEEDLLFPGLHQNPDAYDRRGGGY
ncbi:MAG: hypothetical protein WD009_11810 [Phycisphaeraceae bacterium]